MVYLRVDYVNNARLLLEESADPLLIRWAGDSDSRYEHDDKPRRIVDMVEYALKYNRVGGIDAVRQVFEQQRDSITAHYAQIDRQAAEAAEYRAELKQEAERLKMEAQVKRQARRDDIINRVVQKAGYRNTAELDGMMALRVVEAVDGYRWGSGAQMKPLLDADVEPSLAAGAIWKYVVSKFLEKKGKTNTCESLEPHDEPEPTIKAPRIPVDITQIILGFLEANSTDEFTYNQVAQAIGVDFKATSKTLNALVRDSSSPVIMFQIQRNGKALAVYKYAPERKAVNLDPARTQAVVQALLVQIITDTPAQSGRRLCEEARARMGRIDDNIVDKALRQLVASGVVVTAPGPRRATLHYATGAETASF